MKVAGIVVLCALAAGTAFADTVIVGGQSTYASYPFRGCWSVNSVRSQGLVLPTDAVPAGTITKWEWYTYTGNSGTFNNFKLRCCHTNLTSLTTDFTANYAGNKPVEVYSRSAQYISVVSSTWFGFDFDTPFQYDGINNLIMEVDWNTDSGGYAYCRADSVPGRFVYSSNGGGPYVSSYLHYQRITITPSGIAVAPTSLGRVKSLFQ